MRILGEWDAVSLSNKFAEPFGLVDLMVEEFGVADVKAALELAHEAADDDGPLDFEDILVD